MMKAIRQLMQFQRALPRVINQKILSTGLLLLVFLLLPGCGEDTFTGDSQATGSTTTTTPTNSTNTVTGASVASIQLLTSSPSLGSSPTDSVDISAIVKDTNNNLVSGVDVVFSSNGGDLTVTQGQTSVSGVAIANLTTASDPTNRTITVTAISGTVTSTINIAVTGTTLAVSGATSLVFGDTSTLTVTAKDSDGQGLINQDLTVTSGNGNTLSASTITTGTGGQATVNITGTQGGNDTITVTGLGTTATYVISVSSDQFTFTSPTVANLLNLDIGVPHTVTVNWNQSGAPVVGQTVTFSTTRGAFSSNTMATDGSGNATVTITSSNAGPATITASTTASGPTSSIQAEFVAVIADQLSLQADKTSIGPNGEQATLTAVVRDPNNNLVKNIRVNFTIYDDVSNGSISTPTDTTDSQGRGSTIYTSTSATTSKDGVVIIASVEGQICGDPAAAIANSLCDVVYLTVAQNELFVVLGTSNTIGGTSLLYKYPYTVLVTDSGGNAVADTEVVLTLEPELYETGWLVWNSTVGVWFQNVESACGNEDVNRDGVLDAGEDVNGSLILEPRNVATVPITVTTDESGFANFTVDYAKQFALWVNVTLTASAGVAGTESSSSVSFWLPASATDMKNRDNPPSYLSPYGATSSCTELRETIPYNVFAEEDTSIVVYWRSVSQALTYNVYRLAGASCPITAANIGSATQIAADQSTTFYVDSGAVALSSYCYAITGNFPLGILDPLDTRNLSATEGPVSESSNIVVAP